LRANFNLRVKMPDALLGLVTHPLAVISHIFGQALCTAPVLFNEVLILSRLRIYRWTTFELGRDLDHRLIDEYRHWVQVAGIAFQPESLRFEWQRTAAGEGVVEGRQFFWVEQLLRTRMVLVLSAGGT